MEILEQLLHERFNQYFKKELMCQEDRCFFCTGDHLSVMCDDFKAQEEYWEIENKENENVKD